MKINYLGTAAYEGVPSLYDNCRIVENVTILAGAKIGSGYMIGEGSVIAGETSEVL